MAYKKDVYKEAKAFLDDIRTKNIKDYEQRKKKFREKFGEGAAIEDSIARASVSIARLVFSGGNVKQELTNLKFKISKLRERLDSILKKSGFPKDYLKIHYSCEICSDTGFVGGSMCSCFKKILRRVTYDHLSKLSPLTLCSFSTFNLNYYGTKESLPLESIEKCAREKMKKIYDFCLEYANNFSFDSENIFMLGETGVGKTHLSLAIAKKIIEKDFGVVYVSVPNITAKLEKERFRFLSEETTEKHLMECDLLILDDLGTEYHTAFSNSAIYNIINTRLLCKKSTIINTNCNLKTLETDYSKRLVSRILGHYKFLQFCGKDIRVQKAMYKAKMKT